MDIALASTSTVSRLNSTMENCNHIVLQVRKVFYILLCSMFKPSKEYITAVILVSNMPKESYSDNGTSKSSFSELTTTSGASI